MIYILIAVFVSIQLSNAKANEISHFADNGNVLSEFFVIKGNDYHKVYYLYKIPYYKLVFERDNSNIFESSFEIELEIKNSNQQVVQRKLESHSIQTSQFEETISKQSFYYGFIKIELTRDSFFVRIILNDLKSNRSFAAVHQKIDLVSFAGLQNWLVVKSNNYLDDSLDVEVFGKAIPHSAKVYDLLFNPSFNIDDIKTVLVTGRDSIVTDLKFQKIRFLRDQTFKVSNNNLSLVFHHDNSNDYFSDTIDDKFIEFLLLKNVNQKLYEGDYKIKILDSKSQVLNEFPVIVRWFDKPRSLQDLDLALEMIELMEDDKKFKTYFSSEEAKKNRLLDYWKSKDPTLNTAFNELMNEFYLRVDFAQQEFIAVAQKNGAYTDRGKIFILNGKPDKIERLTNSQGRVIEQWYYNNPQRSFKFIDSKGDGNFKLMK
jgi:GWxTD domain-containing protein